MSDISVNIEENDIEACHRFGKPDVRSKSKKTVVRFVNKKNCNKIFENKKKLIKKLIGTHKELIIPVTAEMEL